MNAAKKQAEYLQAKAAEILGVFGRAATAAAKAVMAYASRKVEAGSGADFNAIAVHNQPVCSSNQRYSDDQVLQKIGGSNPARPTNFSAVWKSAGPAYSQGAGKFPRFLRVSAGKSFMALAHSLDPQTRHAPSPQC